jgi:hypothetical protein
MIATRKICGGPGVIRTPDLRFRKPLLYPAELRGLAFLTRSVYNVDLTQLLILRGKRT